MTEENQDILSEPSNITPISPETVSIGTLLRTRREKKDLSLKSISQQTKIHIALLESLEHDDIAHLPNKTYIKGFVKSVAKLLDIDQDSALSALERTYHPELIHTPKLEKHEDQTPQILNTATVAVAPIERSKKIASATLISIAKFCIGIFLIGIISFNFKNFITHFNEEKLKLPQVLSTTRRKIKTPPKSTDPKNILNTTKKASEIPVNSSPIQVNLIEDKKNTNQKTEVSINNLTLKTISLGEKQFYEDTSVSKEQISTFFPSRYKVQVTKGVENLFINAIDGDSWLTYKVDDKEIKKYVLRQGRSVFIRGEKIRMFLGNARTVKIFYNNKLMTFASKIGTKNIVLPEDLKTTYMAPLFVFQKNGSVLTSDEYVKLNQPSPKTKSNQSLPRIDTPLTNEQTLPYPIQ